MNKKIILGIIIAVIVVIGGSVAYNSFTRVYDCCHGEQHVSSTSPIVTSTAKDSIITSDKKTCSNGATNYPHCNADLPISSTQAFIKITSPNSKGTYKVDNTINITWISKNLGSSKINIMWCKNINGYVCNNIIAAIPNTGKYTWEIPSNFQTGNYKIFINNNDINNFVETQSDDYITITN